MDTVWGLFRKRASAFVVLVVSAIVFVTSVIICVQNYQTTYGQLSRAFGSDIGLSFTVFAQAIEFLVPILLAWGIMQSLRVDTKVTVVVVATGAVAWITDVVTAFEHFMAVSQASGWFRLISAGLGSVLFVTMEIWVILSLITFISAISMLQKQALPDWLTKESSIPSPPKPERRSERLGIGILLQKFRTFFQRREYTRISRPEAYRPTVPLSKEIQDLLPKVQTNG